MKLMQAYRILKCYSEREVTGKDCSRLKLDEAIKTVLPEIKTIVDEQEEQKVQFIKLPNGTMCY